MKKSVLLIVGALVLSSCAHLNEQGQKVQIVESVKENCESRGLVSEDGFNADMAEINLRNAAGKKGANRVVIKSLTTNKEDHHVASGTAYSCKNKEWDF